MVKVGKWYKKPNLVYVYKIDPAKRNGVYYMECFWIQVHCYRCAMKSTGIWEETHYDEEDIVISQHAVNGFAEYAKYLFGAIESHEKVASELSSEIKSLQDEIRELKHGKFTVLIVDQWTSTGNMEEFSLADFQAENVHGGDSDTVRAIGVASYEIREVFGNERPVLGEVWFIEEDGKLKKWKYNYDTSD
jgi:hypothetical protein